RHRHVEIEIEPDAAGVEFEWTAAALPRGALCATEHAVENVLEPARATEAARTGAAGAEGITFEAAGTGAPARPAAGKALEARLAFSIDLAAVVLLALFLVAEDLVGSVDLGKTRGRFWIVVVAVWMMLLGELAISALDGRSAGSPRHPQDLI